jgi:hypothetical protein
MNDDTAPDLAGDKDGLFVAKLPFATAYLNNESIRLANVCLSPLLWSAHVWSAAHVLACFCVCV